MARSFQFECETFPAKGTGLREGLSLNLVRVGPVAAGEPKEALLFARADVVDPKTNRRVDDGAQLLLWGADAELMEQHTLVLSWAKDAQHFYEDPFGLLGPVGVAQVSASVSGRTKTIRVNVMLPDQF